MAFGNIIFQILFADSGLQAVDNDSAKITEGHQMFDGEAQSDESGSLNVQSLNNEEESLTMKIIYCIGWSYKGTFMQIK